MSDTEFVLVDISAKSSQSIAAYRNRRRQNGLYSRVPVMHSGGAMWHCSVHGDGGGAAAVAVQLRVGVRGARQYLRSVANSLYDGIH